MNKPLAGALLGTALGFCDGASAWFYPSAHGMMTSIMVGSSVKGMIVGVLSGVFARKVRSVRAGIAFGAAIGLLFAWLVAMQPSPNGQHYYLQIMAPGFLVGAIIGFLTQRLGNPAAPAGMDQTAAR